MKVGRCNSNEKRKQWQGVKARSLGCYSILQASSNSSHPSSTLPSPGQARPGLRTYEPKGAWLLSLPVSFPSIRYTQGKQEGIRMGPDRHLVCWEISLGRSERLPSPLPAPAHQMWGEGYILLLCAQQPGCTLLLFFLKQDGTRSVGSHTYQCVDINTLSYGQLKQNFLTSVHLHLHYDWVLSSTGLRPPAPSAGWWGWGWATAAGRHSSLIGWTPDMEQRFAGAHPSTLDCMVPESKVSKKYSKYM